MAIPGRISVDLLTTFEAIYARQGISAAARQLNLSQPALSHSLARLRETFNDPLFIRHGNGLVPTRRADELINPIRAALESVDAVLQESCRFDPRTSSRHFNIGLRPAVETLGFTTFVKMLLNEAPNISLVSRFFKRTELSSLLAKGEIDFAIDVDQPVPADILKKSFGSEPLQVYTRPGHPLQESGIDLERYLECDHILVSPRRSSRGPEDLALNAAKRSRRIKVHCQHPITAWSMVAESDMICTLFPSQVRPFKAAHDHLQFDFPLPSQTQDLSLFWHRACASDPASVWLLDFAKRYFDMNNGVFDDR